MLPSAADAVRLLSLSRVLNMCIYAGSVAVQTRDFDAIFPYGSSHHASNDLTCAQPRRQTHLQRNLRDVCRLREDEGDEGDRGMPASSSRTLQPC